MSAAGFWRPWNGTARAMAGVHTAYYLVHSLAIGSGFEATDRQAAANFAQAAASAGVRRIVYLGGLGDSREQPTD